MDFMKFSDWDLVEWLASYSGHQAGCYPGLRRTRLRAEREAARRGLPWWRAQTHGARLRVIDVACGLGVVDGLLA